jgi:hypothetical protein
MAYKNAATPLQSQPGTKPLGWEGGLRCRRRSVEDPRIEDKAHAHCSVVHGVAIHLASDRVGSKSNERRAIDRRNEAALTERENKRTCTCTEQEPKTYVCTRSPWLPRTVRSERRRKEEGDLDRRNELSCTFLIHACMRPANS